MRRWPGGRRRGRRRSCPDAAWCRFPSQECHGTVGRRGITCARRLHSRLQDGGLKQPEIEKRFTRDPIHAPLRRIRPHRRNAEVSDDPSPDGRPCHIASRRLHLRRARGKRRRGACGRAHDLGAERHPDHGLLRDLTRRPPPGRIATPGPLAAYSPPPSPRTARRASASHARRHDPDAGDRPPICATRPRPDSGPAIPAAGQSSQFMPPGGPHDN